MCEVVAQEQTWQQRQHSAVGSCPQSAFLTTLGKESTTQPLLERHFCMNAIPQDDSTIKIVCPRHPDQINTPATQDPSRFCSIINSAPGSKEGFRLGSPHPLQSLQIASPMRRGTCNVLSGPDLVTSKISLEKHGILWQKWPNHEFYVTSQWILCWWWSAWSQRAKVNNPNPTLAVGDISPNQDSVCFGKYAAMAEMRASFAYLSEPNMSQSSGFLRYISKPEAKLCADMGTHSSVGKDDK